MNLKNVLKGINGLKSKGNLNIEIEGIESNSNNIKKRYMFVAISGFSSDGHDYIKNAIKQGSTMIITENMCPIKAKR